MADLVVYPTEDYNSYISEDDADNYFAGRLHAEEWDALESTGKETALLHAFRSLNELDLIIQWKVNDTTGHKELADSYNATQKSVILTFLKHAQVEEALHHVRYDVEELRLQSVDLGGGLLSASLDPTENPPRHSPTAINILAPFLRRPTVSRYR